MRLPVHRSLFDQFGVFPDGVSGYDDILKKDTAFVGDLIEFIGIEQDSAVVRTLDQASVVKLGRGVDVERGTE